MIITRLKLTNWRNFTEADVPLLDRAFIIGPTASGKSNLLDAIRFLRDVAKREGGGLQAAVRRRGGVREIRSLSAPPRRRRRHRSPPQPRRLRRPRQNRRMGLPAGL